MYIDDVPEDKQSTIFLTMVKGLPSPGQLVAPKKPKEMTIKTRLQKYYEPKPTERFHFHQRSQAVGESVADYMAEL